MSKGFVQVNVKILCLKLPPISTLKKSNPPEEKAKAFSFLFFLSFMKPK